MTLKLLIIILHGLHIIIIIKVLLLIHKISLLLFKLLLIIILHHNLLLLGGLSLLLGKLLVLLHELRVLLHIVLIIEVLCLLLWLLLLSKIIKVHKLLTHHILHILHVSNLVPKPRRLEIKISIISLKLHCSHIHRLKILKPNILHLHILEILHVLAHVNWLRGHEILGPGLSILGLLRVIVWGLTTDSL